VPPNGGFTKAPKLTAKIVNKRDYLIMGLVLSNEKVHFILGNTAECYIPRSPKVIFPDN
jgi:hypothetical protein